MTDHNHKWKRIYYRKKIKGNDYQSWIQIPDSFICEICLKTMGEINKNESKAEE